MNIYSLVWVSLAYTILHELLHFVAARLRGLRAYFRLATDGVLPSPSVYIDGDVDLPDRLLILYLPYLVNVTLLLLPVSCFMKLFALFTLPNVVLEDGNFRKIRIVVAIVFLLFIFILIEKYFLLLCSI